MRQLMLYKHRLEFNTHKKIRQSDARPIASILGGRKLESLEFAGQPT